MLLSTMTKRPGMGCTSPSSPAHKKIDEADHGSSRRTNDGFPRVDEDTLTRYYAYYRNLSWPFTAYYPLSKNPEEKAEFRCTAVELLDQQGHLPMSSMHLLQAAREVRGKLAVVRVGTTEGQSNSQFIED